MMIKSNYTTTDKSIRKTLIRQLNTKYKNNRNTAIIPEFTLPSGSARIDIAVVNGLMQGYELKSDFDTLVRLRSQIEAYNLIFDKVTLIVGKKHIIEALNVIPDWWGITIAKLPDKKSIPLLLPIRQALHNPSQNINSLVHLLWKEEAISILKQHKYSKSIHSKLKTDICRELTKTLDPKLLKELIRYTLVQRFFNTSWRSDGELNKYDG